MSKKIKEYRRYETWTVSTSKMEWGHGQIKVTRGMILGGIFFDFHDCWFVQQGLPHLVSGPGICGRVRSVALCVCRQTSCGVR